MWRNQSNRQLAPKAYLIRGFFWSTRNRILFWYTIILCFIFVGFIPAFRQVLYARVNSRVYSELYEKMKIFEELLYGESQTFDTFAYFKYNAINRIRMSDKRLIKPPQNSEELREFFDAFLGNQIPEDDTFLIVLWKGNFYKSSPRARPKELSSDSKLIQYWTTLTKGEQGEKIIPGSSIDSIIYLAKPVTLNGKSMAVFAIAHTTAGERGEVLEAVTVIIQLSAGVLILALVLAWVTSGKILAPLRLLAQTTRNISELELNQRIFVDGKGELAELATTFNDMMDRLQTAFISQRNFINDAGHELRTPITIIRGHLELMGDDPQEIQETLALVMDELERMNRLVNDLILLAKAEQSDFLLLETVDVRSFTEELFVKIKALGDRNWQLQSTAKGKIVADRQRLTQAVMNLVQNATQHTKNTDTITIGSAIYLNKVKFWVHDTGEGIAKADQQRIFQRFARAVNSRRRSEGSGLGLSIVQAIVEAHGGKVILASQLGAGATFTILLPLEAFQEKSLDEISRRM
ncbi:HAMP domain-containing histidine kinase [Fortiea sp. LEGE XX443]|uniref:sensor histidine kinase n=1 Tax=Fortiea sp. LEGE XX443 TaxID=1828611 RepID=UPI00187F92C7|nr:HAMP domain-containing sensor histidine kinase [Fortiea sp. LEGE XX443]MBE9004666.1 HAMP domain-containing histidine kinase [Fortiea sp. LEGE XX443]